MSKVCAHQGGSVWSADLKGSTLVKKSLSKLTAIFCNAMLLIFRLLGAVMGAL